MKEDPTWYFVVAVGKYMLYQLNLTFAIPFSF